MHVEDCASRGSEAPRCRGISLRTVRVVLWIAVAVCGALMVVGGEPRSSAVDDQFNGEPVERFPPLPSFELVRASGGVFSVADVRGRLSLVTFGFTNCPDACPTNMLEFERVRRRLGDRVRDVDLYFVTVDPARDTPERLLNYVDRFGGEVVALTGSSDQLARAYVGFGVVVERSDSADESNPTAIHTASSFLVDAGGRVRVIFPSGMNGALVADDVARVASSAGPAGVPGWLGLRFGVGTKR